MQVTLTNFQCRDLLRKIDENYEIKASTIEGKAYRRYLRLQRTHDGMVSTIGLQLMNSNGFFKHLDFLYPLRIDYSDWSPLGRMRQVTERLRGSVEGVTVTIDADDLDLLTIFQKMDFHPDDYGCAKHLKRRIQEMKYLYREMKKKKEEQESGLSDHVIVDDWYGYRRQDDEPIRSSGDSILSIVMGAALGSAIGLVILLYLFGIVSFY